MTRSHEVLTFAETTRDVLHDAVDHVVLLPVGACEQHGPHLPTGTDFLLITEIAQRVAAELRGELPVVVAPTLPVGYSAHHLPFGATISVSSATYQQFLIEMCESLLLSGFRRLFILNGHGGNSDIVNVVAREVALRHHVKVGAGSYWVMAWDALVHERAHERARLPGHAGAFESSLVAALWPELVRDPLPERDQSFSSDPRGFHSAYFAEDQENWLRIDGFSDNPRRARSEDGSRWLDAVVHGVADGVRQFGADLARRES